MKISIISDVHIKNPYDEADKLFNLFLNHPLVKDSERIYLLGDIFDLMCGPHKQYLEMYAHIFNRLEELRSQSKEIYYFEGNHDVHLEKLFQMKWKNKEITSEKNNLIHEIEGKKYYFSHGDEHEVDNEAYQEYKKFIMSKPLEFIANNIMPLSVLNYFGEKASKKSRKQGAKIFNEEKVKNRFRSGVEQITQGKYDIVVGGHSHVKDMYLFNNDNSLYINNGYALNSRSFIFIKDHKASFELLG